MNRKENLPENYQTCVLNYLSVKCIDSLNVHIPGIILSEENLPASQMQRAIYSEGSFQKF